jgi:hypothetical protein
LLECWSEIDILVPRRLSLAVVVALVTRPRAICPSRRRSAARAAARVLQGGLGLRNNGRTWSIVTMS